VTCENGIKKESSQRLSLAERVFDDSFSVVYLLALRAANAHTRDADFAAEAAANSP